MGIFSGLFKSRDKPENRTAGSSYTFYMGGTTSGKTVTERSAMQMTAVYSCVRILAEAVAGLPLHLYRYTDDGGKEKALDHPLYHLLHDEPNPEMSSFVFRETLMTHLLLWGNAYAQIIRNGKGEVVALYPLMPNKMTVDRDASGQLYYRYLRSSDEAQTMDGSIVTLLPCDVLHIPGLGFDGLVGYSPIAMAKNAIGMAIACEEYGAKFFANGAAPGGVLEHPGTIKDPQRVRESWQATFGGSGNANKIAVLEEGMKYTPIGISPEQAQFLETRKFQINEIARIFRVPPHMVGDLEKSSFSNIEQQSLEFVKYTLDPWLVRWEHLPDSFHGKREERAFCEVQCGWSPSWRLCHSHERIRHCPAKWVDVCQRHSGAGKPGSHSRRGRRRPLPHQRKYVQTGRRRNFLRSDNHIPINRRQGGTPN